MSTLQAQFNTEALGQLAAVSARILANNDVQERSNLIAIALRHINNCNPSLDEMNDAQKQKLTDNILCHFNSRDMQG